MESKFIKGTNKKYSIRKDGKVIHNYNLSNCGNKQKIYVYKTLTSKVKAAKNVYRGHLNGNSINFNARKLLIEYFGFNYCDNCNQKYIPNISKFKCDSCRIALEKKSHIRYRIKNYEKIKKYTNQPHIKKKRDERSQIANKNHMKQITVSYVKHRLGLKKEDKLSKELYLEYKNNLLFKREIAKKFNVSMQSLK